MRHATPWLLLCVVLGGLGAPAARGQGYDPLQPYPIAVPLPNLPRLPAPVSVPLPPPVSIPTPIIGPQQVNNPIGNPIGNPIQTPIGNVIGNPIQTPIGNVIGNPIATPDVTQGPDGRPAQGAQGGQGAGQARNGFAGLGQDPAAGPKGNAPALRIYVGTYTNDRSKSEGIYSFNFDGSSGQLGAQALAAKATNPSFLAIHPSGKSVYAVSEVGQIDGSPTGAVMAYGVDRASGALNLLNTRPSGGSDPCYIALDRTAKFALVANYTGGSVATYPVDPEGRLGEHVAFIQHRGSSVNRGRQSSPHAHAIDLDPKNVFAIVPDLGLDKLMVYHFDATAGRLSPNIPASAALAPGAGPRHLAFQPDGRHAYVINEMASTITVFDYDSARGTFSALETIHTRPDPRKPGNATAEVLVHPSGRFVYGSNRGDDTIAIFSVAPASGKLTHAGFQPTGGKTPRNCVIDPTGSFLLVGNQDSNTISTFRIDQSTGHLDPVGDPTPCPAPVCIRFTTIDD